MDYGCIQGGIPLCAPYSKVTRYCEINIILVVPMISSLNQIDQYSIREVIVIHNL